MRRQGLKADVECAAVAGHYDDLNVLLPAHVISGANSGGVSRGRFESRVK
jgi:hypothetical protein